MLHVTWVGSWIVVVMLTAQCSLLTAELTRLTHSLAHSLTHSLTLSLTHSLSQSVTQSGESGPRRHNLASGAEVVVLSLLSCEL